MLNVVVLHGRVSRPPEERELPSGDRLITFDVTVPGDAAADRKAESVPVAWFGPPGWAVKLQTDAEVVVEGRVSRRFFRAGGALQSRTEVVVSGGALAHHAKAIDLKTRAVKVIDADGP
jgi:single-strand DNA-binding protein